MLNQYRSSFWKYNYARFRSQAELRLHSTADQHEGSSSDDMAGTELALKMISLKRGKKA